MFVIKKLTFKGEGKETSSIELKDGLNIIYGPSNTGKTYVAESIDYMFGGEEFPLSEESGYSVIEIEVETDNGQLKIIRDKNTNTIGTVESTIAGIESKEYSLKPGNGKVRKDTISDVWLKLLGIDEPTDIYRSEDLKTQAFTTRAFNQIFIVKEDYIHQKEPIIKKGNKSITAIKAALLYLLNDTNYIVKNDDDNKTKATKRKALETYLNEQMGYISSQREELAKKASLDVKNVQAQIDDALNEIEIHQSKLNSVIDTNRSIYSKLNTLNSSLSENQSLHKKYKALKTQYSSDAKRLQLIIDGEVHEGKIAKPIRCPFCNGELHKKEEESCVEAAKVEIESLLPRIKDLEKAEIELNAEIQIIEAQIRECTLERDTNNDLINRELKPQIAKLKSIVSDLTQSIEASKEAEMLLKFENRYKDKLEELSKEAKEITKFEPNDLFGTVFIDEMNNLTKEMLTAGNYENYNSSYFDINSFDLVVNGQTKKTQGKGFRAFLNTVLAYSIQSYMKEHASHFMNLFVIDSPILTLREKDDEAERADKSIASTMKKGLMKYFVDNSDGRQVIIIENEIPNIEYGNANIIHFTKSNEGRYGLLKSLKQ